MSGVLVTGTLKCSACKAMTRHTLLRDEDIREHRDGAANGDDQRAADRADRARRLRDASDDDCSSSLRKLTRVVPGSQGLALGVEGRNLLYVSNSALLRAAPTLRRLGRSSESASTPWA
jgi:hypothetical protein